MSNIESQPTPPQGEFDPQAAKKLQTQTEIAEMARQSQAAARAERPVDPAEAVEANAENRAEQSPDAAYLYDLVEQMQLQQPGIYRSALEALAVEKSTTDDQPATPEDIDALLQEKLQHQSEIPTDVIKELADNAREEEITPDSQIWANINADSQLGDVARQWQEFYRRTLQEVVRS